MWIPDRTFCKRRSKEAFKSGEIVPGAAYKHTGPTLQVIRLAVVRGHGELLNDYGTQLANLIIYVRRD